MTKPDACPRCGSKQRWAKNVLPWEAPGAEPSCFNPWHDRADSFDDPIGMHDSKPDACTESMEIEVEAVEKRAEAAERYLRIALDTVLVRLDEPTNDWVSSDDTYQKFALAWRRFVEQIATTEKERDEAQHAAATAVAKEEEARKALAEYREKCTCGACK